MVGVTRSLEDSKVKLDSTLDHLSNADGTNRTTLSQRRSHVGGRTGRSITFYASTNQTSAEREQSAQILMRGLQLHMVVSSVSAF